MLDIICDKFVTTNGHLCMDFISMIFVNKT